MKSSSARRLATAVAFLALLAFGCATAPRATTSGVELQLEQLPDAGFAVEDRGAVSIAYQLTVKNALGEPLTLRRIEMRTIGRSPYTLRDAPAEMTESVEPGGEAHVTFTMWAYPREGRTSAKESVWVNGVAYFERPSGSLRQKFALSFREP
jgi:hypothetical protein